MNSVHEQCPNSDLKQCTVTKLGWVHSAHTQNQGRAHNKLVARMSRAHPAQVAGSACAGRVHSAQVVGECHDLLPLPSPRPGRDITSRSRPPGRPSQVATSIPCRDLPSAQPKQPRSRPQNGVATPVSTGQVEPCRDINSVSQHHTGQSMSRHQNQVATLLEANLCRDINFMSRPSFCPQWDVQVATPKIQVATSHTATHVATSE